MTGKRAGPLLEPMRPIDYFTLARAWGVLTDDEFFAGALTEVSHHGTRIGALRDLFAWRQIDRR